MKTCLLCNHQYPKKQFTKSNFQVVIEKKFFGVCDLCMAMYEAGRAIVVLHKRMLDNNNIV